MPTHDEHDHVPAVIDTSRPSAKVHRFPRKARYTPQDYEDLSDARRLVFMQQSLKYLMVAQQDMHGLFGEVIKTADPWPFYSVRMMQNFIDPAQFELFTRNGALLEGARTAARLQIEKNMAHLSRALLADTGVTLSETSGLDLRQDPQALKRREEAIKITADIVSQATPAEQEALAKVVRVTQHGLRSMFNLGGTLSDMGKKAIGSVAPAERHSIYEHDTSYVPPRRQHLRIAEHWLHVTVSEMTVMKLDLLADFKDPERGADRQQDMFDGAIVQVTPPQRGFIEADAQSTRDLRQAGKELHLALVS